MLLTSDTLTLTAPLITRRLIREISRANAIEDAESAGFSTAGLTRPKPLYHSCGLAVSLFAMLFVAGLASTHCRFRAVWIGYLMHGAVSALILGESSKDRPSI